MTLLERLARRLVLACTIAATTLAFAANVAQPAITAFRANPEPVLAGTTTTYAWTLTGTSATVACTLDPGDGTPTVNVPDCAQGPTTQHAYSAPGTYTATLDLPAAGLKTTTHVTVVKTLPTNAKPGTLEWKYQTGFIYQSYIYSSPALGKDGSIVFGSGDRHIYALHPDGTLTWKVATHKGNNPREVPYASGMAYASPSIGPDGTIYAPVVGDGLYALSPDGTPKWHDPTQEILDRAAAIGADGTVYLVPLRHLDAIHPDGSLAWSFQDPHSADFTLESAPVIGNDGTIYEASEHDAIYAFNPDGAVKWHYRIPGDTFSSSPAIGGDGTLYVGGHDLHTLYAITPGGKLKWKFEAGRNFEAPPSIGPDGTVYVANDVGILYAINPDGTLKWQQSLEAGPDRYGPHMIRDTATIGNNGILYVGSDDGTLYAFHLDGTPAWSFHTPKPIESAPVIASNGTLYVTSTSGALYAIHVTATGLANSAWPKFQNNNRNTGRAR
jgi:outer membrane protein assembly factor BamB